jgi:hypothetical protein
MAENIAKPSPCRNPAIADIYFRWSKYFHHFRVVDFQGAMAYHVASQKHGTNKTYSRIARVA